MTKTKRTDGELLAQYGRILASFRDKDTNRVHTHETLQLRGSGPMVSVRGAEDDDAIYIVICLDPLSPIGEFMGRYAVPFTPDPEFHLDKAHLWIYPVGTDQIRLEVRVPAPRRFADQDDQTLEMIYGVQVKTEDCRNLELRK